ncbi:MAG TPA: hypothetical protein VEH04_11450 [Verrucomicrobiae bacterium]|nr:hypothetical protein [Verrucomicrobiae bacterium]
MTFQQIFERVTERKPVSKRQLRRYFKPCEIQPVGMRQRPQQYPDDAADRILAKLGLKIVSMAELRDVRRRAQTRQPVTQLRDSRKGGKR